MDKQYDIFIPVNEQIWKINKLIMKTIFDIENISFDIYKEEYVFFNKTTGIIYDNNETVLNTDIRNGTEIVLLPITQYL